MSYIVLAVAFVLEGYSLRTGLRQVRGEAAHHRVSFGRYLRRTPDTAVKAVVMEDSAALAGLLLAAGGLLGGQLTGSGVWDAVASLCIGALLLYVAWVLGRSNAEFLVGRPLSRSVRDRIRAELVADEHIEAVLELTTLVQGPRRRWSPPRSTSGTCRRRRRSSGRASGPSSGCARSSRSCAGSTWTRRRVSRSAARRG